MDRATQEYRFRSGAKNTYWIDQLVKYVKVQGLWDAFRIYPFENRTNADTGSTAYGLGGLTSNEMTLVNGPTWGASGLAFARASSQYGTITDPLGTDTLTIFNRITIDDSTPPSSQQLVAKDATGNRCFYVACLSDGTLRLLRSGDGSSIEAYDTGSSVMPSTDTTLVTQWVDGGGRSLWLDKSSESLSLFTGSAQTSMFDPGIPVNYSARDGASFTDQTAHALAFLTGTVTTTQRETITDYINLIGTPPPDADVQEFAQRSGATDILAITQLVQYAKQEGLWGNLRVYPMVGGTNAGTGSVCYGLGGLTTNEMQFINGVGWTEDGATFASASSQYGSIPDFLSGENVTLFHRASATSTTAGARYFSQWETATPDRSFILDLNAGATGTIRFVSSDNGANADASTSTPGGTASTDRTIVLSTINATDTYSIWINKSLLVNGTGARLPLYDTSVNLLINASNPDSPLGFNDQTVSATAFLTGTVTTTQRKTITDLINAL
jgi:hypothetical protein